ncbi:hypothetical protein B0H14DRAFT_3515345 [Mycena olivaceomarginata]|nr:hypothetical protein B0H14DRAFT_3515345 [Mycena olivaceomarginata]
MEKREAEREREREEKRESGTCVARCASTRSPHRPRRGGEGGGAEMVDGDGDEESAHDVRRPAAPHTPPVACAERERHRWGGRSVGSQRCSGWGGAASASGTSSGTGVTSLTSLRLLILASDAALRPLRVDYSSRSARASIPPSTTCSSCDSYGARAAPASPRCGGEDAGYGHGDEDGDGDWAPTSDARMHSIGREPYPHEQLLQTFLWSLACPHLIAYLHSLSDPD